LNTSGKKNDPEGGSILEKMPKPSVNRCYGLKKCIISIKSML